jgi:hypothetical protein
MEILHKRLAALAACTALGLSACGGHSTNALPRADGTQTTHYKAHHHIALPHTAARHRMDASGNLVDGGFESGGYTYWQQCGSTNASVTTARANSGSYSELAGSESAGEFTGASGLCQQVTIPAGGQLTFYVYQGATETNTAMSDQEGDLLDAYGNTIYNFYTTLNNTNGWQQQTVDLSQYAGQTVWIYFGVYGSGSANDTLYQYVDDVAWANASTPTPAPSSTPAPGPTGTNSCNNQQFINDQNAFASGALTGDQLEDVCGTVTQVLPSKVTTSGNHGYFYVQMPNGYNIEIVSNLDAMAQAPTNAPPSSWPWVAVGNYVYVQGRYYYDNSGSQGIDWTEDDTSSSWPYTGDVVVCDNNGNNCNFYW